jgi:hypothetical protein
MLEQTITFGMGERDRGTSTLAKALGALSTEAAILRG